jgi:hypothetical protein
MIDVYALNVNQFCVNSSCACVVYELARRWFYCGFADPKYYTPIYKCSVDCWPYTVLHSALITSRLVCVAGWLRNPPRLQYRSRAEVVCCGSRLVALTADSRSAESARSVFGVVRAVNTSRDYSWHYGEETRLIRCTGVLCVCYIKAKRFICSVSVINASDYKRIGKGVGFAVLDSM